MKNILYLHGFEETHSSPKPAFLKSQFGATFLDLGMYITKRNSPILYGLTSKSAIKILLGAICGGLVGWYLGVGYAATGFVASLLTLYYVRREFIAAGAKGSFEKTLAITKEAIKSTNPDLLVGFSWGGALATKLLFEGIHKGNVLLLAPAHEKMSEVTMTPLLSYPASIQSKVTIIHCSDDGIVPLEHSRLLKEKYPSINLIEVAGQGHKLWGTLEDGLMKQAVSELL
eukprot:TRINITY_DN18655_c0_g1_i1.p1 TRINITY_DN18655_c0_g1~~TRINITY_DN18655_c0_g1_i1.p1  ORF type:complete len:229 (+),score=27.98 TRINITY_DN18655_c0_g1_i1:44-730(+)